MRTVEANDSNVSLHSGRERANLIISTHRTRAAQRCGVEGLFSTYRGSSPTVRESSCRLAVRRARALSSRRASVPIQPREQRCKACFFQQVTRIVAGYRITAQTNTQSTGDELCERRAGVTKFGIRLGTMRNARAALFDEVKIAFIDVDAMR